MITEYERFRIIDKNKKNDFFIDVNYKDDPEVRKCKTLKFTFPNGDVAYVDRELLNTFLFTIGKIEDQGAMIPKKLTTFRTRRTMLGIVAKKDIKKGEKINVEVDIKLPPIEEEVIGEVAKRYNLPIIKPKSGIIVPKK